MSEGPRITARDAGVRFGVHVQPRASRTELAGTHGGAYKIRLMAMPADGAANEALVRFLSERFVVPPQGVRIVSGAHSRAKVVEIDGVTVEQARRVLLNQND